MVFALDATLQYCYKVVEVRIHTCADPVSDMDARGIGRPPFCRTIEFLTRTQELPRLRSRTQCCSGGGCNRLSRSPSPGALPSRFRRYLYRCHCKDNVGKCLRLLTDTTVVSMLRGFGKIRYDSFFYSNSDMDIGCQHALTKRPPCGHSHRSVGRKSSSKLDRGMTSTML